MEKDYKKILNNNITQFLSYTVLFTFVFVVITLFLKYAAQDINNPYLSASLSVIGAILIFNILHFICKSSTLDSFKDATLRKEDEKKFLQKMNLFFVICIFISITLSIGYIILDKTIYMYAISQAYSTYSIISDSLTADVIANIHNMYQKSLACKTISTIIIELSLVTSFISLIHYQENVLKKFNKKFK